MGSREGLSVAEGEEGADLAVDELAEVLDALEPLQQRAPGIFGVCAHIAPAGNVP